MPISSKLFTRAFVCSGIMCVLTQQMTGQDPDAPTSAAVETGVDFASQPQASSADSSLITTAMFADMRAALSVAKSKARELGSYTATMEMQEEVNGQLKPLSNIQIKLRQQPFSVYMRWDGNGQEALFVDGRNAGRLLAKPANGLAAIKRLWRLDPESRMAKQGCRYPITASGIENLVNRVHDFYSGQDDWTSAVTCSASQATEGDAMFMVYEMQFLDRDLSPMYLKSRLSFEKSSGLLLRVQNYGWTDETSPRLLEHYVYRSINPAPGLEDHDFDEKNSAYEFVTR